MAEQNKFDECDFYHCDSDACELSCELSHEHVVDALIDFVDQLTCARGAKLIAELTERGPVTVHGWVRLTVPDGYIVSWADSAAETIRECWSEEYGNPNDSADLDIDMGDLEAVVRDAVRQSRVWACERTAERTYSVDAVIAVLRAFRPRWFEEATNG